MASLLKKILQWGVVISISIGLLIAIIDRDNMPGRRDRAFRKAAGNGKTTTMRVLLLMGAKANGYGALDSAVSANQLAAINFLLDRGADVNAPVKVGWTPLMSAAYYDHIEAAKLLLSKGANINAIGDSGTALDIAIENKKAEMIDLLKVNGAQEGKELRKAGYY